MIKMEVFSGGAYCAGCVNIGPLVDEFASQYEGKLSVEKYVGNAATERLAQYHLSCVPALVIGKKIIIEGICPSRETLANALKEAGL